MSIFNIDDEIQKLCPEMKQIYRTVNGKRELCYQFPPLDVCRKLFEEAIGVQIDWDADDTDGIPMKSTNE